LEGVVPGIALDLGPTIQEQVRHLSAGIVELEKRLLKAIIPAAEQITVTSWKQQVSGTGDAYSLGVRSGDFRNRIRVLKRGIVGTDHPGARIHEYGGVIVPKNAPYLRFQINGQWITTDRVVMPKRPHREPAVKEAIPKIEKELAKRAKKEIAKLTREVNRGVG